MASAVEHLRKARLDGILMRGHQRRRLVVVLSAGGDIRQRVVVEERGGLRADES